MKQIVTCVGIVALIVGGPIVLGYQIASKDHGLMMPSDLSWGAAPPSLPAGAQAALLEGDPAKEGPLTLRLRLTATGSRPTTIPPSNTSPSCKGRFCLAWASR